MKAKPQCLLLDACIIIGAIEEGCWEPLLEKCRVAVPATVVGECLNQGHNIRPLVDCGTITEFEGTDIEIVEVRSILAGKVGIDSGELEALALMRTDELAEHYFCTSDAAAVKAAVFLDMHHRLTSLEEILNKIGYGRALAYKYTRAFLQQTRAQGFALKLRLTR